MEPLDNSPPGQERPRRPPPPLPRQQLPHTADPSATTGTGPHRQLRLIPRTFRATLGRRQEPIDSSSQRELDYFSPLWPPRAVETQLGSSYFRPPPPGEPELWEELHPSIMELLAQRYRTLLELFRQVRETTRQIQEIGRQARALRQDPRRVEEVLYRPQGQGQAGFRQGFHYVVAQAPANRPAVATQTFPSAMDVQNFAFLQNSGGPSRVLQPTGPSAWFSAPAPAVHPPTTVAPNIQYDLNLQPFSSDLRSSSGPGSSSGPASAAGTASSSRLERMDGRGTKRSRENIE